MGWISADEEVLFLPFQIKRVKRKLNCLLLVDDDPLQFLCTPAIKGADCAEEIATAETARPHSVTCSNVSPKICRPALILWISICPLWTVGIFDGIPAVAGRAKVSRNCYANYVYEPGWWAIRAKTFSEIKEFNFKPLDKAMMLDLLQSIFRSWCETEYNLPRRCGTRVVGGDASTERIKYRFTQAHKEKCQRPQRISNFFAVLCELCVNLYFLVLTRLPWISMCSNVVKLSGTYCVFLLPCCFSWRFSVYRDFGFSHKWIVAKAGT